METSSTGRLDTEAWLGVALGRADDGEAATQLSGSRQIREKGGERGEVGLGLRREREREAEGGPYPHRGPADARRARRRRSVRLRP
jgi:hypothetical protein